MSGVLGIETSSAVCSVGLVTSDGKEFARRIVESHIHSEKILKLTTEVCELARVPLDRISAVAVSEGPGSFTGLRIGVSTAKGLCFALHVPLIAVPTFEAMVAERNRLKKRIVSRVTICIDAKQGEWYTAHFELEGESVRAIREVAVESLEQVVARADGPTELVTDTPEKFRALPFADVLPAEPFFSGAAIARVGFRKLNQGRAADIGRVEPRYLKDFVVRGAAKTISL